MIVSFGTYDAVKHPRVGIVIDGLRERGEDVRELNHPLGFSTAERVRMLKQPWRLPGLAWRMLICWIALRRDARALLRSGAVPEAVLVGYMGHFDVLLARRLFRRSTIVLDHLIFAGDTAQDRGARGLRVRLLRGLDSRALSAADVVLVDTVEHLEMLPDRAKGVHVPVGARAEWFDARRAAAPEQDGPVSLIFFGLFTPLQGAPTIARALRRAHEDGASFRATIVGTGQDYDEARASAGDVPGITWLDWVEAHELPALVARHDVCMGVFGTSEKALRVVPNKVYEGAAAGCAIVTGDTAPQRAAFGDAALYAKPGDADALSRVIAELAATPARVAAARAAAAEVAESFRAGDVVVPLLERLRASGVRR
ncbi:glycosyltransferase [Microbacterium sp. JZ31]|uniref:glycosyltransferase n=1 Tax=Microbacterium sp. JZ31 TaxID=1906274 RepID=UPI00193178DF|nr:glycosyltransferase [Microbacterium sp. JZ31]